MDYSVTFARHFSRLLWLLLNDGQAIEEQKSALRALVQVSGDGPVRFTTVDWRLMANDAPLPDALTGVQDLSAQMIGHAVATLEFDRGAIAADILGVARILSVEPVPGDGGRTVQERLASLGARTVRVTTKPVEMVPRGVTPASSPVAARLSGGSTESASARTAATVVDEDHGASYLMFSARPTKGGSVAEFLSNLDRTRSVSQTTRLLDELVTICENANREGRADIVSDAFHGIVVREADVSEPDLKRAYTMAIRRMAKPTLLRAVAAMLTRARDRRADHVAVLSRAGEDGADALIEQLTMAQNASDRRQYFDALLELNAGVQALVHHLGDPRWYVARNAADLLGEMVAPEAEAPLSECLKHDDDRVRRAAANALGKLGTPGAMKALHGALKDTSPQVRLQAAAGLAARKGLRTSGTLIRALEEEPDPEVQFAILAGLGKVGTPDAVQTLIKAAEPATGLFKKKPTPFRLAAVQALGEVRSDAAIAGLKAFANDKDREVRETATRLLSAR